MKKIIMAFGAAAMLFSAASCAKSGQEVKADNFSDSLALYFGRSQGALCAERIEVVGIFVEKRNVVDIQPHHGLVHS